MRVYGSAVQASRGEKNLPPATLSRMELSVTHKRCATQWTRQRIPDFAGRNRLVHGCQQNTIVGHDLAERCRCVQPIQSSATRQRWTAQDCPSWIVISNHRFFGNRSFLYTSQDAEASVLFARSGWNTRASCRPYNRSSFLRDHGTH